MQQKNEQELPAKNPNRQDDPFQLWAMSLNGALEEPIVPNGHGGVVPESQRNGGSSEATTRAASRESQDAHLSVHKKDTNDWLAALRRRVRIENERQLLERGAVNHALEEFDRVHGLVEAKWCEPNRLRRIDKYEALLGRFAEKEVLTQPEEAGTSTNQDSRRDADAGQQSDETVIGQNPIGTREVLASDKVTFPESGGHMLLLVPNSEYSRPSWGNRHRNRLAKGNRIINRYSRLIKNVLSLLRPHKQF